MVSVLLSPPRIAAHCLEVSFGNRTDPHVTPGGRDNNGSDALQRRGIANLTPVRPDIAKDFAGAYPADARHPVAYVSQACVLCRRRWMCRSGGVRFQDALSLTSDLRERFDFLRP